MAGEPKYLVLRHVPPLHRKQGHNERAARSKVHEKTYAQRMKALELPKFSDRFKDKHK